MNSKNLLKIMEEKVSSSISKKTNYIIAGDNMGPSKRTKAEDLEIKIISETDYLNLIS